MSHLLDEPHHDGSVRYVPEGSPRLGDTVPVRVRVPSVPGRAGHWDRPGRSGPTNAIDTGDCL